MFFDFDIVADRDKAVEEIENILI
jgi:hypothetical protein